MLYEARIKLKHLSFFSPALKKNLMNLKIGTNKKRIEDTYRYIHGTSIRYHMII